MAKIFGLILDISSNIGTVVFIVVIVIVLLLEHTFRWLETKAHRHGYIKVYERLKQELTVLGIISFFVFIYQSANTNGTTSTTFLAFEMAHIIILFIAVGFILQALLLVRHAALGGIDLLTAIRSSHKVLAKDFDGLKDKSRWSWDYVSFYYFPTYLPIYPRFRLYIEYRIIEKFFLEQHPLPKGFKFSKYATNLFKEYVSELGDVSPFSWLLIIILVGLNYSRLAYFDTQVSTSICLENDSSVVTNSTTYESLTESHNEILSKTLLRGLATASDPVGVNSSSGCVNYVLPYASVALGSLTVVIILVYFLSSYYYSELLNHILESDFEGTEEDNPSYSVPYLKYFKSFLSALEEYEIVYRRMTQHNLLELVGSSSPTRNFKYVNNPARDSLIANGQPISPGKLGLPRNESESSPRADSIRTRNANRRMKEDGATPKTRRRRMLVAEKMAELRAQGSIRLLSDIYQRHGHDIMSIDEYKEELDYIKSKLAHEEELAMSNPWYYRVLDSFEIFWSLYCTRNLSSPLPIQPRKSERSLSKKSSYNLWQSYPDELIPDQEIHTLSGESKSSSITINNGVLTTTEEKKISKIFLFQSPKFHFYLVEFVLLLQCFYISLWATQLIPLAITSNYEVLYILVLTCPLLLNVWMMKHIIRCTVILHCAQGLHDNVVDQVCDESIQETNTIFLIRRAVLDQCEQISSDHTTYPTLIKERFQDFDQDSKGSLNPKEFRKMLGQLNIFITKERFDLVWEVIDYDISNTISWDELLCIIFPEYQYDIKQQMELLNEFRMRLKQRLITHHVPKTKWRSHLYSLFQLVDSDHSEYIDIKEFEVLLKELGFDDFTYKQFKMLFLAIDVDNDMKISFSEFCSTLTLYSDDIKDKDDDADIANADSPTSNSRRLTGPSRSFLAKSGKYATQMGASMANLMTFKPFMHSNSSVNNDVGNHSPRTVNDDIPVDIHVELSADVSSRVNHLETLTNDTDFQIV